MSKNGFIEYTKEQCLYALKRSIEECQIGIGVVIAPEVIIGIYNYISDDEKLMIKENTYE